VVENCQSTDPPSTWFACVPIDVVESFATVEAWHSSHVYAYVELLTCFVCFADVAGAG
jgi:hypothetical protein